MKKIIAGISTASLYLATALPAFATSMDPCPTNDSGTGSFSPLCDKLTTDNLGKNIGTVIFIILVIAVLIALFFLIWGGIRWIISGGDKAKVETARSTIIAAIVGLIIAFLAFFIIQLILTIFGLGSIKDLQIPTLG